MQADRALEHRRKLYAFILAGKPRSAVGATASSALRELLCAWPPPAWFPFIAVSAVALYSMAWLEGTSLELRLAAIGVIGHAAMLGAAALMIGLRGFHAQSRWSEGHRLWSELVSGCRNLASSAAGAFTDVERMERLLLHTITFAWAVRSILRGQALGDDTSDSLVVSGLLSDAQLSHVNGFGHAPMALIDLIRSELRAEVSAQMAAHDGRALGHWDLAMSEDVRGLLQAMTACEALRAAPAPLHILPLPFLMVCWLLAYQALLVGPLGWQAALLLGGAIGLLLLKLERVAEAMSEPFGMTPYDLPTDELCAQIEQDLLEIMCRSEPAAEQLQQQQRRVEGVGAPSSAAIRPPHCGGVRQSFAQPDWGGPLAA